jgi:microcin C transport system substrate-binding protein
MIRVLVLSILFSFAAGVPAEAVQPSHGLAMHGDLQYGPGFTHFDYANPDAPKGGLLRLAAIGNYDSLNPFILKGQPASGISLVYDTLMAQSSDEPFSEYGLIAASVEVPKDRSWVIFNLRPEAHFHDGSPITADDVIYSLETLKTKGHPFYRSYYAGVESAEKLGPLRVKFSFANGENRELSLVAGQMPVLSKAYWQQHDFSKTTLTPWLSSGPYRISKVDPGRSITYQRVEDYWGRDLPVNKGRYNFDTIRFDYYRDATVALQALKGGEYDLRQETISKNWATAYDFPALKDGRFKKEAIPNQNPSGMQGFLFNTRRAIFKDPRVRRALAYAFDFEWTNKNLFYGAYKRTTSYFANSELASSGLPSVAERAILAPFAAQLPKEVLTEAYTVPSSDGSANNRRNLRTAARLLKQAGWVVKKGKLVNKETGQPLRFEILLVQPAFERVVLPFVRNLKRLGIEVSVRTVDSTQYQNRIDGFDFDMVVTSIGQSLSPGNEQRDMWLSSRAAVKGSRNLAGIADPVVDALVEQVITAPDRQSLVDRTRALDRVLLWGHYVIPQWHLQSDRVAYWDKFSRPARSAKYGLGIIDTWWAKGAADRATGKVAE